MDGVERIRATLSAGYEQNHPFRVQRQSDRGSQHSKRDQDQKDSDETPTHEDRIELHDDGQETGQPLFQAQERGEAEPDSEFHFDIAI